MCLNARIRSTLELQENSIPGRDADATFFNVSEIYVIVLLHYYLQCGDALMLEGMPMPCSNRPSRPMFTLCRPRNHQCLVVPGYE